MTVWWKKYSAFVVLVFLLTPNAVPAERLGWPEAVTRLTAERTKAETCTALLKQHGDSAAVARGALNYGNAKAEMDAVIAGLVVTIAQKETPEELAELEIRLQRGVAGRRAFCKTVEQLLPSSSGEKNLYADILKETIGPLIEAVKEIYLHHREENTLERKTIQTQLEAAIWPAFSEVKPVQ